MGTEWEKTTVGELVQRGILERPLDGNHGSIHPRGEDFVSSGVPFIMASDLVNGGIDTVNCSFITIEQAKTLRKGFAKSGDVLLSHKATLGRTALVGEIPGDFVMLTPQVTYYRPKDSSRLNNRYLKFYFDSVPFQQVLQSWSAAGSTRAYIGITDQLRLPVVLPPITEQRAIASVLGALDDKIELNRRMNETLEALAQTLFKSWFVDATQSALPKGWREGTLGEIAENPRRGINAKEIKADSAYIGLEHMPRRCIALSDWGSPEELESNKSEFQRGEILFGKLRPYFHKVGVAPLDGVCSTDILVVRPKETEWFGFVLGHVSSAELVEHTNAASTGTKMPRTNWNDISRFEVALPPKQLAADFTEKIRPMVERIISNIHESRTLAALRDALLPKLLSGELRVPTAVKLMEAHT